jgi:aminoglycoside 6'-N-acetyltransferase I
MSTFSVRSARLSDQMEVAGMCAVLWPDGTLEEHRGEIESKIRSGMSGTLPCALLVATDEKEELLGFIEVGLRSHADGCDVRQPVGYVEGWFVREEMRGRGIGKELMKQAEAWSRTQNCREIASDALLDNMASQRAHAALGFEIVDRCVLFRKNLGLSAR